jgi:hypothetical protein
VPLGRPANDLCAPTGGKPPQRAQEHRRPEPKWKTRLAPERYPPRVHCRNRSRTPENPEEYREFEGAILAEYLPQTPVEQELVRRLASLFWRLRRRPQSRPASCRCKAN